MFSFPEGIKSVLLYQGAANAVTCDIVSMKNLAKGWFQVIHTGANDTDLVLTVTEATDITPSATATFPSNCRAWIDSDAGTTSDTIAATTAATAFTIDPATQNGVNLLIEVDPSQFTDGYDCVYLADTGGHASNVCTILFHGLPKWAGASIPTIITN